MTVQHYYEREKPAWLNMRIMSLSGKSAHDIDCLIQ